MLAERRVPAPVPVISIVSLFHSRLTYSKMGVGFQATCPLSIEPSWKSCGMALDTERGGILPSVGRSRPAVMGGVIGADWKVI